MSRWIEEKDGKTIITIADMEQCKWMYNEICCCDKSDEVADYPYHCDTCKYFEKEDGKVE